MAGKANTQQTQSTPAVLVKVLQGETNESKVRFSDSFVIGRGRECDLRINDGRVSRQHVKVFYENGAWKIQDLESRNGTFVGGERITEHTLTGKAMLELGEEGPVLLLETEQEAPQKVEAETVSKEGSGFATVTEIIEHYFTKSPKGKAGMQTMMFQDAFKRVHKKKSLKYYYIIGASLCLLLIAGGVILYQKAKFNRLSASAQNIFYSMKALEIQIARLEELVLVNVDPAQAKELRAKRELMNDMSEEYDKFVKELDIYKGKSVEQQIVFRMARLFGECELVMPKAFVDEVFRYIGKWKTSDRLQRSIERARSANYAPIVSRVMDRYHLPPQYFFLALQESNFRSHAVGPMTRYGIAKGIWQFIPMTASHYGLKVGPRYEERVYDPHDERYNFERATDAAARYLKDINSTEAQASGLLVMASYNWGDTRTRKIIGQMPENPRERNFWRLLEKKNVPRETYNYVFYIFSAAVICENPRLFGFDVECPDLTVRSQPSSG